MKKVLILSGDGINCERETATAFERVGFRATVAHINDLVADREKKELLKQYSALALPGGFSFGDDISSGRVLAIKIRHGLGWDLQKYARDGGLVIGICNGFQALIRLGAFGSDVSITHNSHGKFIDTWVRVKPSGDRCVWLKGLGDFEVPIRHGEGRILFGPEEASKKAEEAVRTGRICLRYEGAESPNGSSLASAGLTDETGRIFGLMPHPEAFLRWTSHPSWTADRARATGGDRGDGLQVFERAFQAAEAR